ncbi:hypothetical protein NGRA_2489 [Nosema granulosis]|uniref:Uncharacterized protein n=1 Tax=Nosema granulosis TaxID=83296 RepID=A0A9P6GWI1_9MICR|nr:hypothetical protein NGRA_2489 [Nosema granulosis]
MSELHDRSLDFQKLCLIVSDAATYAIKPFLILNNIFSNLKHVICLSHLLYTLCEKVRSVSENSNFISSKIKRHLIKSRENQAIFKMLLDSTSKVSITYKMGNMIEIYKNNHSKLQQV